MGRSSNSTRRASRFDQLTPDQERAYRGETASLLLTGRFRSFTGKKSLRPSFEKALKGFEANVADFRDADALTHGFVLMCNSRRKLRSNRAYEGIRNCLKLGILTFARAKSLNDRPLGEWPVDLGKQFAKWLSEEALTRFGERLSPNTARRYHGEFCSLFAKLGESAKTASVLPNLESFPNNPFSGAHGETERTKSLGLSTLIAILRAARAEFQDVVRKVQHAQALFKGPEVLPDLAWRSKIRYRNIDSLLWYLHKKAPEKLSELRQLAEDRPSTVRSHQ